jgi:hypothetical protein
MNHWLNKVQDLCQLDLRNSKYCRLVAGGWFVLREKYWWLVADKPSEQGEVWSRPAGAWE